MNLYKVKFYNPDDQLDIAELKNTIQEKFSLSSEELPYYFLQDETSNMLYSQDTESIKILKKDGRLIDISEVDHPLINSSITEQVKKYYICFAQ